MENKTRNISKLAYSLTFILALSMQPAHAAAPESSKQPVTAQQQASNPEAVKLNDEALRLANSRNFGEAVTRLEQAAELDPGNKIIKNNLAMIINSYAVSVSDKDPALASELYEKGVNMEGAPYNLAMNYGTYLLNRGKYEEAGTYLEKALSMTGVKPGDEKNIRITLGHAYTKRGFYDEAIAALEPAAAKNSPEAYYLLGKVYYTQSKFENAVENLENAVKYGKNTQYGKAAEDLLKKVKKEGKVESKFESQSLYHFTVQFDGEKRNDVKVDKAMQFLEEAYNSVGSYFNYYPEVPTPVIIYSKKQFKEASGSPVWVAALYDGKIRLPLDDVIQNPDYLKTLIFHEYTHTVIYHITHGNCPVWLNEGFAQMLEGDDNSDQQLTNVKKYYAKKQVFDMKSLEGSFMGIQPPAMVSLAYDQSILFTKFLIEKAGQNAVSEGLSSLGQGRGMGKIMEEDMYTNYKKLQDEWLDTLK